MSGNTPYDILNYYYMRPEIDYHGRKGEVYGQDIHLLKDDMPIYIDFENTRNNYNAPTIKATGPLYSLSLYTIGPGTLYYSVNMRQGEGATAALPAGAEPKVFRSYSMPLFKTLNLRSRGAETTINLTMEI